MSKPEARVGIGVLVCRPDGKILVGKRKVAHGSGEYALPGGHLEYEESFEECAVRELLEETGIDVSTSSPPTFEYAVNAVFRQTGKHYVTIFMRITVPQDCEAKNLEPEKCFGWEWVNYDREIPQPIFFPLQLLLDSPYQLKQ